MTNVSKNQLSRKELESLLERMVDTLANLNKDGAWFFMQDLLGYEERIMLAKRLAMIIMSERGYSVYKIAKVLHVSPTTANKFKKKTGNGHFNHLLSQLKKSKKNYLSLLETVDSVLHLGGLLPHYGDTTLTKAKRK